MLVRRSQRLWKAIWMAELGVGYRGGRGGGTAECSGTFQPELGSGWNVPPLPETWGANL